MKRKTILLIIFSLSIIFIIRNFTGQYKQVEDTFLLISPIKLVFSFLCFLVYLYMRAFSWSAITYSLGATINQKDSLSIWFLSEATRYIPGSIWSFASRAYLARQKNLTLNTTLLMLPIEIIIMISIVSLLSLYATFQTIERLPKNITIFSVAFICLFGLIVIFILQKKVKKTLKKYSIQNLILKDFLMALFLQLVGWSFYGLGTILLINNLPNFNGALLFSSSLLAWLIGYLSIITPMGLGVRESAFVFLAGSQIGLIEAFTVAILHRLILTAAEVANLIFWITFKRAKRF